MTVPRFPQPAWHEGEPGLGRRLWRGLVRDVLMLCLCLPCAEVVLRVTLPELRFALYTDTLTGGHEKRSNAFGLRERAFERDKPAGERRVLCIGDSTTYGSGVAEADTYPRALERLFAPEKRVFVINAGGEGSSLGKARTFLERDGLSFSPDVVVVGFSPTMVSVTAERGEHMDRAGTPSGSADVDAGRARSRPTGPVAGKKALSPRVLLLPVHRLLTGTYTYAAWDTKVRKRLYRMGVLRDRVDKQRGGILAYAFEVPGVDPEPIARAYRVVAAQLIDLRASLRLRGIPLLVVALPYRFELGSEPRDNERGFPLHRIRIRPVERLRSELANSGIEVIDPLPALQALRRAMLEGKRPYRPLFLDNDYGHLDATGNEVVAQLVHARVEALLATGTPP